MKSWRRWSSLLHRLRNSSVKMVRWEMYTGTWITVSAFSEESNDLHWNVFICFFCSGVPVSWLIKNWPRGRNPSRDFKGVEGSWALWNHDSWGIRWDDFNKDLPKVTFVIHLETWPRSYLKPLVWTSVAAWMKLKALLLILWCYLPLHSFICDFCFSKRYLTCMLNSSWGY